MTASVARRATSEPIPPQTRTMCSCSKNLKERASYSLRVAGQVLMKGQTSLSRAATMATLGVTDRLFVSAWSWCSKLAAEPSLGCPDEASGLTRTLLVRVSRLLFTSFTFYVSVEAEPFHCAAQGVIYRDHLPAEFPFCFGGGHEHFFAAHSDSLNRGTGFTAKDMASDYLIRYASR